MKVSRLGAELNSEFERETAQDTTEGPPRTIGSRGAAMADVVAGEIDPGEGDGALPSIPPKRSWLRDGAMMTLAIVFVWLSGNPVDRPPSTRRLGRDRAKPGAPG